MARALRTRVSGPGRRARWPLGRTPWATRPGRSCPLRVLGRSGSLLALLGADVRRPVRPVSSPGFVQSRVSASGCLRSRPCLRARVPVFAGLGLSTDRLLLSFWARSQPRVTNAAGRSPCSPPRPLPWRRSELWDWRAGKSAAVGRLHPSPPGSPPEPALRQRGVRGGRPRSPRGARGPRGGGRHRPLLRGRGGGARPTRGGS